MKRVLVLAVMFAALYCGSSAWAVESVGCKDHPLFSRMANFEIYHCATMDFDAVGFPKPELKEWNNPEDYTDVEGKVYAISYTLKEGAASVSDLQIIRNFQNAVQKSGGTILGDYVQGSAVFPAFPPNASKYFEGSSYSGPYFKRYLTITLTKGESEFWVYLGSEEGHRTYMLLIVERQKMKQEISVNELEKQLTKEGFLTYYFKFDTGKSDIKPENQDSVDQIAALLKSTPALKVSIEGHTDNVGTPESNKKLSEERARSVMTAVAAKGIAADRMVSVGHGQDRPVADNRKEDGRALNRRVEVVKK
jgi:OOP family OmpA-OmpF porin